MKNSVATWRHGMRAAFAAAFVDDLEIGEPVGASPLLALHISACTLLMTCNHCMICHSMPTSSNRCGTMPSCYNSSCDWAQIKTYGCFVYAFSKPLVSPTAAIFCRYMPTQARRAIIENLKDRSSVLGVQEGWCCTYNPLMRPIQILFFF